MDPFNLSPGITPFITELAVLALPAAVAVGEVVSGRRGVIAGVGVVVLALGAFKLYTDFTDAYDLPVALGGLTLGLTALGVALERPEIAWMPGRLWRTLGMLAVLVGLYKVYSDFYDPFDIELGVLVAVVGGWVALARGEFVRIVRRPPPADPAR